MDGAPAGSAGGRRALLTVGTTRFDALVAAARAPEVLAALAAAGVGRLVMQVGAVGGRLGGPPPGREEVVQTPAGAVAVRSFDYAPSLAAELAAADVVVCHAGAGSLLEALAAGKRVVAVPNAGLMAGHQAELAAELAAGGHVWVAEPAPAPLAAAVRAAAARGAPPPAPLPRGDPARIAAAVDALMGVPPKRQ